VGHVLGEDTCAAPGENKSTYMRKAFLQQMAEEDVQQIVFYIAEDNLAAADAFRAAIEKARATLEDLPEIGSPCDFDSPESADLRMLVITKLKNYLLFYRNTPEEDVEIVRVLHGARDISSLFGK
jgi:toxin ParE1/3/4